MTALLSERSPSCTLVLPESPGASTPCRTHDPEVWFADTPDGVEAAKALCGPCPVRQACLRSALARQEPWGVWGGELLQRGVVVERKRPRGRPRKSDQN